MECPERIPWAEGDAIMIKQRGFTLAEPALFLRYHPRGSAECTETAVFVRTGNVCPPSEWVSARPLPSRPAYQALAARWAAGNSGRQKTLPQILGALDDMLEWQRWRAEWIATGKLYEAYDDDTTFDADDFRKSEIIEFSKLTKTMFVAAKDLIIGQLRPLDAEVSAACDFGPAELLELVRKRNWPLPIAKKSVPGFISDFQQAKNSTGEGMWVNLCLKPKALESLGIPAAFLRGEGYATCPVPTYDQLILHCDGTDQARTLGMHRDVFPGCSIAPVATLLGCFAGEGKEMLIWRGHPDALPIWWKQEGLPCELFDFVYSRTGSDLVQRVVLKRGQFIFMPRGLWHWVRPLPGAKWTAMVTGSFHSLGEEFGADIPAVKRRRATAA